MANSNYLHVNDLGFSDSSFSDDTEEEEEFVRRFAMSTKTAPTNEDPSIWKVGMHCRAVDKRCGVEYEAVLLRIIKKKCIVRYLGYDNTELVLLSDLIPSLGNAERNRQIQDSVADKVNGSYDMECGDQPTNPGRRASSQKKKNPSNKRNKQTQTNSFDFPDIAMPNLAELKNLSFLSPLEMPPLPMLNTPQESEDQALSSMLLSWYMSGYYTGLYEGMKRAQEEEKNKKGAEF